MTMKKAQKSTSQNRAEMARHGARSNFACLGAFKKFLKAPRGCCFEKMSGNSFIERISGEKPRFPQKCAKRWFKGLLMGGLKQFRKTPSRSLTIFPILPKNRRFAHVQVV